MRNYIQTTSKIEECLKKKVKRNASMYNTYSINRFSNDYIRYFLVNIIDIEKQRYTKS